MLYNLSPNFDALDLQMDEIYRNLGYGNAMPDEVTLQTLLGIVEHAGNICRPAAQFAFYPLRLNGNKLLVGDVEMITGKIIAGYLTQSTEMAVFVATAGLEYDAYLQEVKKGGDIYMEFLADAVGSEIAEATVRHVSAEVHKLASAKSMYITLSYSPGYCGWHVREQPKVFSLLKPDTCGITLNDSCLMHPVKSVSGIIGLSTIPDLHVPYSCEICGLQTCYKRKVT